MNRWLLPVVGILWFAAAVTGMAAMLRYERTPGLIGVAPGAWPGASTLVRDSRRPTVLVFLHPLCACSEATLRELEVIVGQHAPPVTVQAVFSIPPNAPASWRDSSPVRHARSLPGGSVRFDLGAAESRRFGAWTSGWVTAYGAEGTLLFAGGVTDARGVAADNASIRELAASLATGRPARARRNVFGCALENPAGGSAQWN